MNIGLLLSQLRQQGIPTIEDCPVAINVARDLKISCFPAASPPLFLRILERIKGEADFENLRILKSHLGSHINGPMGVVSAANVSCGVFPFVTHQKVSYDRLRKRAALSQVRDILSSMHTSGLELNACGAVLSRTMVMDAVHDAGLLDDAARAYLETSFPGIVGQKPAVLQHCDFTYANLAVTTDGTLLVFDWEEYGVVRYPGFDFATFLLSHQHHSRRRGGAFETPDQLMALVSDDFGGDFLDGLGFTPEEFARVFPGYLAVFLTLKKDFGARIKERMHATWRRMINSEAWLRIMNTTATGNGS